MNSQWFTGAPRRADTCSQFHPTHQRADRLIRGGELVAHLTATSPETTESGRLAKLRRKKEHPAEQWRKPTRKRNTLVNGAQFQ